MKQYLYSMRLVKSTQFLLRQEIHHKICPALWKQLSALYFRRYRPSFSKRVKHFSLFENVNFFLICMCGFPLDICSSYREREWNHLQIRCLTVLVMNKLNMAVIDNFNLTLLHYGMFSYRYVREGWVTSNDKRDNFTTLLWPLETCWIVYSMVDVIISQ